MYGNINNVWVLTWIPNRSLYSRTKWCIWKNPSYESTAISISSLHRQTWCSNITMIHPHHILLQWAGSPQALRVVYVLQHHSVVTGTSAAACCYCLAWIKSKLRINTKKVKGNGVFHCTLRPESASSWSSHLAYGSGRRQRRSIWPEQSRELTSLGGRTCSPRFSFYVSLEQY